MKVLVTGGAGYVGSAFIMKGLAEGQEIVSVDNLLRGDYIHLKHLTGNPGLNLVVGDICDSTKLEKVLKESSNIDAVVHLAAIPGLERCQNNPKNAVSTNIYGTYNVLEVSRKQGVNRVVFASSAAVYGNPVETPIGEGHPLNPTNLYGVTKLAGEKLVNAYHTSYGLSTVNLRFGNLYGVGMYSNWETVIPKFVKQAMSEHPLTIYGDGKQTRDFIHVLDIIQALMLVLNAENRVVAGETFNIGSGKPTPVNTVAEIVAKIFRKDYGKKVETMHLPPRAGETYTQTFSLSPKKIENQLNFKPQWNIEQSIEQLINACT